jgi:hypothetical protein
MFLISPLTFLNSPPPHPDKHNANNNAIPFLVCQYIIEGVQDLPQELRTHVTMFYKELITLMEGVSESWRLITKEKYTTILTVMIRLHTREPIKLLRSIYPQIYKWCKNYALIVSGETFILVACPDDVIGVAIVDETMDMDTVKRIIYFEAAYTEIKRAHGQDHTKGRTLYAHLGEQFENIGRELCKMFTDMCPNCITRMKCNQPVVGIKPIITTVLGLKGRLI